MPSKNGPKDNATGAVQPGPSAEIGSRGVKRDKALRVGPARTPLHGATGCRANEEEAGDPPLRYGVRTRRSGDRPWDPTDRHRHRQGYTANDPT